MSDLDRQDRRALSDALLRVAANVAAISVADATTKAAEDGSD